MSGWHSESALHRVLTPCVTLNVHYAYTEEHRLTPIEPEADSARQKMAREADRCGCVRRHSIERPRNISVPPPSKYPAWGRCSSSEDPSLSARSYTETPSRRPVGCVEVRGAAHDHTEESPTSHSRSRTVLQRRNARRPIGGFESAKGIWEKADPRSLRPVIRTLKPG
jgi:hypothetical protein